MRVRLCFPIVVIVFAAAVGFTRENPAKYGVFHRRVPAPGQVFVRTSIFRLMDSNSSAIDSLRRGVSAMQNRQCPDPLNLATCDPTSWTYQANIHGTYTINPGATLWNKCQHGSFFFFSWHRMYLYYFERILRAASGDSNFALPYWNYTDDPARTDPDQRQLPQPFRLPPDTAINPLYVANRATPINDGTGHLLLADVDYSQAFQYTLFEAPPGSGFTSFGGGIVSQPTQFSGDFGQLEWRPHNFVHTDIGGWMGDPKTAALDPIFYLHHANIDRLWKRWLAQKGGRQNPNDQVWKTTIFTFYDETGKQVPLSGQDIVDTVGQLGYCYDDDPGCNVPNPPGNLGVIVN